MNSKQQRIGQQHSLNCFSMGQPVHAHMSQHLLVGDSNGNVYRFGLGQQKDVSIHFDDLQQHNQSMFGHKQSEISSVFKMDTGLSIQKCANYSYSIFLQQIQYLIDIIIVLANNRTLQIWSRLQQHNANKHQQQQIGEYNIALLNGNKNMQNITDFYAYSKQTTKEICICVIQLSSKVEGEQNNGNSRVGIRYSKLMANVNKQDRAVEYGEDKVGTRWIQIESEECQQYLNSSSGRVRIVDGGKMVSVGPWLIGIHEQVCIQLQTNNQVEVMTTTNAHIVYGSGKQVIIYNRSTGQSTLVQTLNQVIAIKYLIDGQVFVTIGINPTQAHVYSSSGDVLWAINMHYIQHPLIVQSDSQHILTGIIDSNSMKLHTISHRHIMGWMPRLSNPIQELKVHESTATTLSHRLRVLNTLKSYSVSMDYPSIFRFMQNCNNHGMLNDALTFVHSHLPKLPHLPHLCHHTLLIKLSNQLLQESKYQSHIQNTLSMILSSCKTISICNSNNNNGSTSSYRYGHKQWQQYTSIIRQIIESKKVRKLMQQQKNRRLFQLAYQLTHTANSKLLHHQLNF